MRNGQGLLVGGNLGKGCAMCAGLRDQFWGDATLRLRKTTGTRRTSPRPPRFRGESVGRAGAALLWSGQQRPVPVTSQSAEETARRRRERHRGRKAEAPAGRGHPRRRRVAVLASPAPPPARCREDGCPGSSPDASS